MLTCFLDRQGCNAVRSIASRVIVECHICHHDIHATWKGKPTRLAHKSRVQCQQPHIACILSLVRASPCSSGACVSATASACSPELSTPAQLPCTASSGPASSGLAPGPSPASGIKFHTVRCNRKTGAPADQHNMECGGSCPPETNGLKFFSYASLMPTRHPAATLGSLMLSATFCSSVLSLVCLTCHANKANVNRKVVVMHISCASVYSTSTSCKMYARMPDAHHVRQELGIIPQPLMRCRGAAGYSRNAPS